jgi:hypothetical protein
MAETIDPFHPMFLADARPTTSLRSEPIPLAPGEIRSFMIYEDLTRGNETGEDGPSTLTPEEAVIAEIRAALDQLKTEELHNP